MNLQPVSRAEIYRQIRVVLVRHLIDLGRLMIEISSNALYLRGTLERLPGVKAELTPEIIAVIVAELGRIPGIPRVEPRLDNWLWTQEGRAWKLRRPGAGVPQVLAEDKAPPEAEIGDAGAAEKED